MTEPRQVFVQVLKSLTGQKCTPQQAQDLLAERFCSGSVKNKTVVLLVDEVRRINPVKKLSNKKILEC